MLIKAESLRDLSIGEVMRLHGPENLERGRREWPLEPLPRQLALAEQEAIEDLRAFFWLPGTAVYAWQEDGHYCASLRLEPHGDGLLLTCLAAAPELRGRGYGTLFLRQVLDRLSQPVYSHIDHRNAASIRVHEKCGFRRIADTARLLDGSVTSRLGTYRFP